MRDRIRYCSLGVWTNGKNAFQPLNSMFASFIYGPVCLILTPWQSPFEYGYATHLLNSAGMFAKKSFRQDRLRKTPAHLNLNHLSARSACSASRQKLRSLLSQPTFKQRLIWQKLLLLSNAKACCRKFNHTFFSLQAQARPVLRVKFRFWKLGRAVECSSLENCRGCESSVSSNLTASTKFSLG